jgi:hypothetical protein
LSAVSLIQGRKKSRWRRWHWLPVAQHGDLRLGVRCDSTGLVRELTSEVDWSKDLSLRRRACWTIWRVPSGRSSPRAPSAVPLQFVPLRLQKVQTQRPCIVTWSAGNRASGAALPWRRPPRQRRGGRDTPPRGQHKRRTNALLRRSSSLFSKSNLQ